MPQTISNTSAPYRRGHVNPYRARNPTCGVATHARVNTSSTPISIVDLCQQMCQVRQHASHSHQLSFHYLPFDQLAGPETYAGILFFLDAVLEPLVLTTNAEAAGITVEVDLTGFTLASFIRHLKFFRRVATHFQSKFPNRLQKCQVRNAPTFVRQVCTMLATFVDARTMEKIEFVGG